MTDVTLRPSSGSAPSSATLVATIARKELADAVRDRWFWLYAGGFALLAGGLAIVARPEADVSGYGGYGRTAASLVALAQLIVPLMGLTLGARAIAGQHESGTLRFLLSHPISRTEAFVGTFTGLALALLAAIAAGFGIAGIIASFQTDTSDPWVLLRIAGASWLLAVSMLGIGMLVSVLVRRSTTALGTALFVWFVLVFGGDLGLMGTTLATQLPVNVLFFSVLVNPVEAFRVFAVLLLEGSLDVLGPAGSYAVDRFGDSLQWIVGAVLVLWAIVPGALAGLLFRRKADL